MIAGMIGLYFKDQCLDYKSYDSLSRRRIVVDEWKKRYGARWLICYIQIIPLVAEEKVGENGENIKVCHIIKKNPPLYYRKRL